MDLVLRGRGIQVTDQIHRMVERRVSRFERQPRPRVDRLDVEIIGEATPRVEGGHRVHVSCATPRRTFRAEGAGDTLEVALDQALDRLRRQIATYRGKREKRQGARASRIESVGTSPQEPGTPE